MKKPDNINEYLSGRKLHGDDFEYDELKMWYEREAEGYSGLQTESCDSYIYKYHALNKAKFFKKIPNRRFSHVLGFGSAYCEELTPIVDQIKKITVLEPSGVFPRDNLCGVPMNYMKPRVNGEMEFEDASFDMIVCSSALHHVANVSKVIAEFARCVKPGGYVIIREPIVSMGDWSKPRKGLTAFERGIPLNIFQQIIDSTGLNIISENKCMFSITKKLSPVIRGPVYNSRLAVFLDDILCWFFAWNTTYHATKHWHKLRPTAISYVLQRTSE